MTLKQYNQIGGFAGAAVKILEVIGRIIYYMFMYVVKPILIWAFKIIPNSENLSYTQRKKWDIGTFWVYAWWCGKIAIYCSIFMIGGPIVILGGLIYLYSKLFTKMKQRTDGINLNDKKKTKISTSK